MCGGQYIVGASGAIGLNYLAFEKIALRAGVPDDEILDFWEKLSYMSSVVLNEQYREQDRKRNLKK